MTPDHAVRDFTVSRPKLRRDLRFTFQDHRGRPSYILEDLTHRRYFQIGLPEYQFLRSLDGTRTARELLAKNVRDIGERALREEDAVVLLRWLVDQKLLETDQADQAHRRDRHTAQNKGKKQQPVMQKIFFFRIPLGSPDRFLSSLLPWLGWTVSIPFLAGWVLLLFYSTVLLIQNWDPFLKASTAAILPQNWLFLGGSFIVLKLIHEVWHGIVSKKFGAVVPEFGVQILAFITPLTYVDASGSWKFPNRWHRIAVAAAGMFIELLLAALAVIVWVRTSPGMVNTLAHNTIFAASTITVLFNANPLMRFDGYYILSDLIRIPNLATKGQQFTMWLGRKILYGIKDRPPPAFLDQPIAIGTYGVLAFIWRWLIWIGIMAMVSILFKGAGLVLVAFAVIGLVGSGLFKSFKYLFTGDGGARPNLVRALVHLSLNAAVIFSIGYFIHVSPAPKAAAVLHYPDKAILRAEAAGFVREIHCRNNEIVAPGQILAVLDNPTKEKELAQLRLDIQHSELRRRRYFEDQRLSAYQAESELLKGLQEKLINTEALVASLTMRAPIAGRVHGRRLDSLPGRYLQPGDELLTVIPQHPPSVLISVSQKDADALKGRFGEPIRVRLRGRPEPLVATLERVEQRATTAVPHPALASTAGGPLLVRARARLTSDRSAGLAYQRSGMTAELSHFSGLEETNAAANQELTEARFAAYASLPDWVTPETFQEGQWGYAKLRNVVEMRLGAWLYEKIELFVRSKWDSVRSA